MTRMKILIVILLSAGVALSLASVSTARSATPSQIFTPIADAYVSKSSPSKNYGTGTSLRVDTSPIVRSYLRFTVQGTIGSITNATLRVYAKSKSTVGYDVRSVAKNTWGEKTLTFKNAPAVSATAIGSSGALTSGTWKSVDVTTYITGNGTFSLALTGINSTAISFASREAGSLAPQLVVQTNSTLPTATLTPSLTPLPINTSSPTNLPSSTPTPQTPSTTYVSDTFTRILSGSWGNADIGGPYSIYNTLTDYDVDGSAGTIVVPTAGATHSTYLANVSALNLDINLKVRTDKFPAGGSQYAYVVARNIPNVGYYQGQVAFATNGTVSLVAWKNSGSINTILGSSVQVFNLAYVANNYVRLHMQVVGTNPTQIRMKAWADGQAEPPTWQYSATDSTLELQTAGIIGLRSNLGSLTSNVPVVFSFDGFVVTDGTAFITAPTPTPAVTPTPVSMNVPSVYWGAWLYSKAPDASYFQVGGLYDNFETNIAKKKLAIIHWGAPWEYPLGAMLPFQKTYFDNVRNHGSIPMLSWGSQWLGGGTTQPKYALANISRGDFDAFITRWATDAKNWGHPFFLRFDHEMNGNWQFPWSVQLNGNTPADYIQAWRHVHDIFAQVGASNATWVWCPNISGTTTTPMSQVYPGDAYVDWSCLDGYNQYSSWLGFNTVFTGSGINWISDSYEEILQVAPTKPIVIGETASLEAGDGGAQKGAWITDAYSTQLPLNFPRIKAVVWFNSDDGDPANTFPIESSQASMNAYSSNIAPAFYASNNFANLNTSPIPPLK